MLYTYRDSGEGKKMFRRMRLAAPHGKGRGWDICQILVTWVGGEMKRAGSGEMAWHADGMVTTTVAGGAQARCGARPNNPEARMPW